nr:hypothetical protein [Tanacetum cinerariifolium]
RDTVSSSESAPTFTELFKTNELKAQIQEKDTVILKLKKKIKSFSADDKERKVEDIETQNLKLDHRVTKLTAKNNHLKQTYKQVFDSIKSSRVQLKEHCDDLINKVNLKSVEVADLNASLQEKVDVVPLIPKLRKNRIAHIDYIKHTLEEAATLRELVESERLLSPLNTPLAYACKYTRRIQELLMILQQTCPRITDLGTNLVAVTPKNQNKQVRRVALVSSASGSQSKDNTKKNRIRRTLKKAKETELEDHPRKVKSSLNKASVVDSRASSSVIKSVSNVNPDLKCATCNRCLFSDNHDKCVVEYINSVNACRKSKSTKKPVNRKVWKTTGKVFTTIGYQWKPTGQTFMIAGNVCPLTRIATATIVPPREPIPIDIQSKEATLQVVYDVLRNSPLFQAFQVTADATQQYGAILPIELTTAEIRNSKAYQEYYACTMGEAAPKPKASARKKKGDSASSTTPP